MYSYLDEFIWDFKLCFSRYTIPLKRGIVILELVLVLGGAYILYRVILALVRILIFLFSRDTIPLIKEGYCYIGVCACIGRVLGFSYIFNISLFSRYTIPLKRGIVILEFVLVLGGL